MTPEEFKQFRLDMGYTVEGMAKLLGKKKRIIYRYQSGKTPVPKIVVLMLEMIKPVKKN